ncbi:MAG: hypothetical protein JRL30_29030, partial [Deltaproteobacteria bacterium]|nr:hypothetical protein [Deltaproteobacteria bacterium]
MDLRDLSEGQRRFLAVLAVFGKPIPVDAATSLVPLSSNDLTDLVGNRTQVGWLERVNDSLALTRKLPRQVREALKESIAPDRLVELFDQIRDLDLYDRLDSKTLDRLFQGAGHSKEAAFVAYERAVQETKKGHLHAALENQLRAVANLSDFLGDPECDSLFISAAFGVSELWIHEMIQSERVFDTLNQAEAICIRKGDQRHLALVHLHKGRLRHLTGNHDEAMTFFAKGTGLVNELGDEDIMARSAQFFGMYSFIQGRLKEASDYFDRAMSKRVLEEGLASIYPAVVYYANCAVYLGQFYRAIGLMDSTRRRALLESDHRMARFLEACLGIYLLMIGKRREGVFHLQSVEKEALERNELGSQIWSQRALAFCLFLEGRIQESYDKMKQCLAAASRAGIPRPFYSFPWVLELLTEYRLKGFPPIPEYDFEREMQFALDGVNIHLRGVALRLRARHYEAMGREPRELKALYESSETDLKNAQDPTELAKTRADLALLKLRLGKKSEAMNLALQAWEGLSIYVY